MSAVFTISLLPWTPAYYLCWSLLLFLSSSRGIKAITADGSASGTLLPSFHFSSRMVTNESFRTRTSSLHTVKAFLKSFDVLLPRKIRISESELQDRHALYRTIQLAAFEQFGNGKTGKIYNVSASAVSSGIVQAVRLRSGSFHRYGVTINEFRIPRGCNLQPIPERILLVYAQLKNISLFQGLPDGYVLESPVLSVTAYDASNINTSQPSASLNVSTTSLPITIQFAAGSRGLRCASFNDDSTNVSYTDLAQGACQVTHFGAFALVESAPVSPFGVAPMPVSPHLFASYSNAWKIIAGSVVGGLALLVLLSFLALGIASHRRKAKFAKMEYQTDHGEALQSVTIGNSRVPAAGSTRTQSTIQKDYTV